MPTTTKINTIELETMRAAFRKILAFASSAGDTITNRDALEVIKAVAREHVAATPKATAIRRHVDRVREILEGVGRE
jgi:hypothetical protein